MLELAHENKILKFVYVCEAEGQGGLLVQVICDGDTTEPAARLTHRHIHTFWEKAEARHRANATGRRQQAKHLSGKISAYLQSAQSAKESGDAPLYSDQCRTRTMSLTAGSLSGCVFLPPTIPRAFGLDEYQPRLIPPISQPESACSRIASGPTAHPLDGVGA
eukprot:6204462-Pleurochrysis_carterae.AAC.3